LVERFFMFGAGTTLAIIGLQQQILEHLLA
jgi:hypothetical protein